MLIRKPFFALAALATFGLSCLAMSDAFSSDSPDDVPARPGEVSSASINTDARHPTIAGMATTDAEQETATAAIRRIPPVVPNIRWLPPLPADQLQVGEVIPVSAEGEPFIGRQVAATLSADEQVSPSPQRNVAASPPIGRSELVPQAEAADPFAPQQQTAADPAKTYSPETPVQLTANSAHTVLPPGPAPPLPPVTPAPAVRGMELTARAPAAESVASEPVSAVEHVAEDLDPGATEFADGAGSDSCEYDDCECVQCRPGWRRFRRRPKPVVCYHDRPFGWYLRNAYQQQIARGFQDQMVLYHYDFQAGAKADQLSSRGRQQLAKFAQIVDSHGFPVVIQPTNGRPELDAARQAHVAMELSTMTESATEPAVIVAQPRAPGMRGSEALEIDKNLMQQTQQRGLLMRGAGGGGGFGFAGAGIETGLSGGSSE